MIGCVDIGLAGRVMQKDDPPAASSAASAAAASAESSASPLRLAEVMAARLCHDISSPAGAVGNALELIGEPELAGEALALAQDGMAALTARLQLTRAAWCGPGAALDAAAIIQLTRGLSSRPMEVDLAALEAGAPGGLFAPALARLLLNLIMLAAESLPRGGRVQLAGSAATGIMLIIDGPQAAWPAGLPAMLADEGQAWAAIGEPRTLQAPLTALLAAAAGYRLSLLFGRAEATPPLLLSAP